MNNKKKITAIIPTKNRSEYLTKFINNCEKSFRNLNYKIIIIDASNKEHHKKNKLLLKNKKIKIIKQKTKGIQIGCCEALKYVKSKFVVFLYDDDELSKEINKIYSSNMENEDLFSFGYGIVQNINSKVKFNKLKKIEIKKSNILLSYNGTSLSQYVKLKNTNKINLPVSPVCAAYKLSFLKYWKKKIFNFTKGNLFRYYFFFKKEVGPDLLIYLFSIMKAKKINFYLPYVAKFSSHENSISIIYGPNFLRIGYWLARICFYENIEKIDPEIKNRLFTYLFLTGLYLLFTNIFNYFYFKNILKELIKLLRSKENKFIFKYSYEVIKFRILKYV